MPIFTSKKTDQKILSSLPIASTNGMGASILPFKAKAPLVENYRSLTLWMRSD